MAIKKDSIIDRILEATGSPRNVKLAGMLEVTEQTISQYKKKLIFPSIETVFKASELSGTSIHWLLTGDGEKYVSANVTNVTKSIASKSDSVDTAEGEWKLFSSLIDGQLHIRLQRGDVEVSYTIASMTHEFTK